MKQFIILWIGVLCNNVWKVHSQMDPCDSSTYRPLNDVTMLSSYTSTSPICTPIGPAGWYLYTGSSDGSILDSCPTGNQCGTNKQLWMNDSIPNVNEGTKSVKICVRDSTDCCRRANNLQVKNCTTFIVFRYTNFPPCSRLCFFDKNATTTSTTTTTTTTTITTTTPTTTSTTSTTTLTSTTKQTSKATSSSETPTKQKSTVGTTIKSTLVEKETTIYRPTFAVMDKQSRGKRCYNTSTASVANAGPCRLRNTLMTIAIVVVSVLDFIMGIVLFNLVKNRNCRVDGNDPCSETSSTVDDKLSRTYVNSAFSDTSSRTRFNRANLAPASNDVVSFKYD